MGELEGLSHINGLHSVAPKTKPETENREPPRKEKRPSRDGNVKAFLGLWSLP